jgi:phosphoglycolate phosphatase-like HAD superfamily hydrolase
LKKAIIFDFDGVIANSVNIKSEGFYNLYLPFGVDIAKKVIKHHINNGGISRFDKIKYYHSQYLGLTLNSKELEILCNNFSESITRKVIDSSYITGAYEFLQKYSTDYMFFIVTGTPKDEIDLILNEKKISHFFIKTYGSPLDKSTLTKNILDQFDLKPNDLVFVGDALADYNAAIANDIDFILIESKDNKELFNNFSIIKLPNLINLHHTICKL